MLLYDIYPEQGYYISWHEELGFDMSYQLTGVSEVFAQESIKKAIQVVFFEKKLFQEHHILTSTRIQKIFLEAIKRREKLEIDDRYEITDDKSKIFYIIIRKNIPK
ncbi:MAG: DUF4373 domain-containing protein [Flavobacteriales bacterium]